MNPIVALLFALYAAGFVVDLFLRRRSPPVLRGLPSAERALPRPPKVSIIVPARNSGRTIAATVDSLIGLDYPEKEVIVVEGDSNDGTAEALEPYAQRVKVIVEPPLPAGWVGKSWACHQGYLSSSGEYLLFTAADTIHSHDSLGRAASYAVTEGIDVFSLSTRAEFTTVSERAVLPLVFMLILDLARQRKVNEEASKVAWAIGEYILVSRKAYSRLGGHESIRGRIDDDVSLATLARGHGMKVRVMDGHELLTTKMYDSARSLFTGLVRNFYGMTRRSPGDTFRVALGALLRFFLPFVALVYALILLVTSLDFLAMALGSLVAIMAYIDFGLFSRDLGVRMRIMLLLPFSSLWVLSILAVAMARAAKGTGVSWRGRVSYG